MKEYEGLGLMSGTSGDGLDVCYARYRQQGDAWQGEILEAETLPYTDDWHHRLMTAPQLGGEALAKLHTDYGHLQGLLLRQFVVRHRLKPQWACAHGHTVFHQPKAQHFSLQIGDGETLVTYLDCPLVTNLRARDVAQGGEGAPLVPLGEQLLFEHALFLNLGGIANLSAFAPQGAGWQLFTQKGPKPYVAYDLAPCNMVLNEVLHWARPDLPFDEGGQLAAQGQLLPLLYEQLERLPFYYLPPPRSLGREFMLAEVLPLLEPYRAQVADVLHTWCQHVASRLVAELDRYGIHDSSILLTGGGAHHSFLLQCLAQRLAAMRITPSLPSPRIIDFKEAYIFGFLGLRALLRQPTVLPAVTGARVAVCSGSIHLPEHWATPLLG